MPTAAGSVPVGPSYTRNHASGVPRVPGLIVRARRFALTELRVDGVGVELRYGDLVVVAHEGGIGLDWECVVTAADGSTLDQGAYHLDLVTLESRAFDGDAVLVRSVGGTHVLRGASDLQGFAEDDLPT
jgi:hypothetical protein